MAIVNIYALDDNASLEDGLFDVVTDDYKASIQKFLPFGLAWNIKKGGLMDKLYCAMAYEPSRVERRGRDLIEEMDVRTTQELLEDWERVLGLPGDCSPVVVQTDDDRREAAHAKLANKSSSNEQFFLDLAANLGYPGATIRHEHNPFECGISACGDALQGWQGGWTYTWTLIAGVSTPNDALLQCLLREAAQAHVTLHFEYPGQAAGVFIIESP